VRLLFVVQRYGERVAGGAEQLTRQFTARLAARGHHVEVVTSCAEHHWDWANAYPAGTVEHDGVVVHRIPVRHPRDNRLFGPVNARVGSPGPIAISGVLADAWAASIGPDLPTLGEQLTDMHDRFDAAVFSGYLYETSTHGLPALAPLLPTVLMSVAHDEAHLRLPTVRQLIDHAAGICALTPEEAALIVRRFRPSGAVEVVGGGIEAPPANDERDAALRARAGIGERPYVVSVGRIEPGKGTTDLVEMFEAHSARGRNDLHLVLVGSNVFMVPPSEHHTITGFVDDATKWAILRGAQVLVQPSYFESFSLSLLEGWLAGNPALVQARCDVLAGQARRARGGIAYHSFSEFSAALDLFAERPDIRQQLARNGTAYAARYHWDDVLDRFESLVDRSIGTWSARLVPRSGRNRIDVSA
jgi:glycosyltransferase involved in cell wall biosynthesis